MADQSDAEMFRVDGHIDENAMSRAQSVVDCVNKLVYNQLKNDHPELIMHQAESLVLQGSVAEGAKVIAPDEFDYMIRVDLCADHWDIEEHPNDKGIHTIVKRKLAKSTGLCRGGINNIISNDLLNARSSEYFINTEGHLYNEQRDTISANAIIDRFETSLRKIQNHTDADNGFDIGSYHSANGPPITVTVKYKAGLDPDDTAILTLNIDYVPAVPIDERCFVPKYGRLSSITGEMDWRESFSHIELPLMKEIQTQAPTVFKMFLIIKTFVSAMYRIPKPSEDVSDSMKKEYISSIKKIYNQYTFSEDTMAKIFTRLLSIRYPLDWSRVHKFSVPLIRLASYYLKTALFWLWKGKELGKADEKALATAFIKILTEGKLLNFFNGRELSN